jgi:4-amino-4-deoxy-L-arabinose transferase-like glycosyltransferase
VRRSFTTVLALVAAGAFVLRLAYAIWIAPPTAGISDAFYFKSVAKLIADGEGFANPYDFLFRDRHLPTAEHPPLYTLVLAVEWKLGLESDTPHRATGAVFGTAAVVLVGLIGRRIGGDRVGLLAAGLAAVYPLLITTDGAVLSETLYVPLVALCLLCAYRLRDRPSVAAALLLGAAIAAATLTRSEALLLLVLLAPAAALAGGPGRWLRLGACWAAALVLIGPWVVRNWIVFDEPVLSNNLGGLVAQSNCGPAYSGPKVGDLVPRCLGPPVGRDEDDRSRHWRDKGLDYAREHVEDLPLVAAVRLLRTFGLYDGLDAVYDAESRNAHVQRVGIVAYYPLLLAALAGAVVLRRRRRPLALLLAPIAMAAITSVVAYGSLRFRTAAEIPLVLLAAVALAALWERVNVLSSGRDG